MGSADLLLNAQDDIFDLLGFPIELTKVCLEHLVSLLHGLESGESVACLESDKSISILGLGSCSVMESILHLEEDEHVSDMLFSLEVVDVFEIHGVIVVALHFFEVLV